MTHLATSDGALPPAEAELTAALGEAITTPRGFRPLGLLLINADWSLIAVVVAASVGFEADERWIR
jgi:hypothetical protein